MIDPATTPALSCPNMLEAIELLRTEGIRYKLASEFQIKVGPYNFYPAKGTIFLDGARAAHEERGLESFIEIARRLRDRNPARFRNFSVSVGQ